MAAAPDRCILFDWGDTLMRVFPEAKGPMSGWPQLEAIPYARETLMALRPGWTVALATNAVDSGEAEIREALARVQLDELVDRVFCYRQIGSRKPSPQFFEFILGDLGLDPSQVTMVGDSYEDDVLGANQSGIRAVWFNPGSEAEPSGEMFRTIHDLRDLEGVLGCWGPPTD
jgi:putative hydrolase of the HAD superfamily